jgi:acyl-CoA thioester hydrolase
MQGHVFNGHYLTWFDMAHTAMLTEAAGRPYAELMAGGIDVVVAEAGVRYRAPARFDDELRIALGLEPPTTTSLTSRLSVTRNGTAIASGFLRHVCVRTGTLEKLPWPDWLRDGFARYAQEPDATDA